MIIWLFWNEWGSGVRWNLFPSILDNFSRFCDFLKKIIFGQGQFSIWWGFCEILKYTVEIVLRWLCNFACQSKSLEVLQTCFRNVKGHLTPGEHNAQWIRCVRLLEQKLCGKNYPSRVFWEIQFLKLKPLVQPFATKSLWGNHVTSTTLIKFPRKATNIFWVCQASSNITKTQCMLIQVRTSSRA